jgi:hypothetical protein
MDMRVGLQKEKVKEIFKEKKYKYENLWVVISIFLIKILVKIE